MENLSSQKAVAQEYTERKYLCGNDMCGHRRKIEIDMEQVYRDYDAGKTKKEIASALGVSEMTLRRRHKEYQIWVKEQKSKPEKKAHELPPLPAGIRTQNGTK